MSTVQDLDVIIVNYRTPDLTLRCVNSLLKHDIVGPSSVAVVENASPDDSYARLRAELPADVRCVRSSLNRGFGAGVNTGMVAGRARYMMVLNPDTYFVDQSVLKALRLFDEDHEIGLVGLDLTYPDGQRQYSARRFYSVLDIAGRRTSLGRFRAMQQRERRHLMMDAWISGIPFDADWVIGAGFVVKRALYEELGGMDERYFLYMEDVDLCARIWSAGHRVTCVPDARLVHDHQRESGNSGPLSRAARSHVRSLLRFRRKFHLPLIVAPGIDGVHR